jgi:hypothetical protein
MREKPQLKNWKPGRENEILLGSDCENLRGRATSNVKLQVFL